MYIINMIAKYSKVGICPLTTMNITSNFKIWLMRMKKFDVLDLSFSVRCDVAEHALQVNPSVIYVKALKMARLLKLAMF